jgi:hypothetical protein
MNNKMEIYTGDDDDWLDETVDEIARRNELSNKLEVFLEKTQEIIEENEKFRVPVKHVKFKTIVVTHFVGRLPSTLWYSNQEYVEMRKEEAIRKELIQKMR